MVRLPPALLPGAQLPRSGAGIPESLQAVTPEEFRYWEVRGEDARARHHALLQSGFFAPDNVELIGGQLQKVEKRIYRPVDVCGLTEEDVQKAYAPVSGAWMPIRKANPERQSITAVVLEPRGPDNPDLQKEFYSAEEIWNASKRFMQYVTAGVGPRRGVEMGVGLGLMHQQLANEKLQLIGNLVVPVSFDIIDPYGETAHVEEGTWIQEWYVPHVPTWVDCKSGSFNGVSIDGNAMKFRRRKKKS